MTDSKQASPSTSIGGGVFAATHWSVVAAAGATDSSQVKAALETLCRAYWKPIYTFVRRQGYSPHDCQDLVQDFFAGLLQRNAFSGLSPEKGRFRSFLLVALKNFLANEWDKGRAQKRGGGQPTISIEGAAAETGYLFEPAERLTAEKLYERRWALTLLERVLEKMESEYRTSRQEQLFTLLKGTLALSGETLPYQDIGRALGMTEGAVKVAAHRFRQHYRALLRAEIAQTVSDRNEVDGEIRALFAALSA